MIYLSRENILGRLYTNSFSLAFFYQRVGKYIKLKSP